jgi:hypothetical protein
MLQLITSIIGIMVVLSATADCDCLVPSNNSHTLNRDDFLAVFSDSVADLDDNFAALNQAIALLDVSFTRTQLAAFLGTIRSNTENLRRHRARCADSDSCPVQYDLVCNSNNRAMNDSRHFYPRSALMISYQCNYADIDAVLRSALPCLRSIESEPDLVSDRLLYSYLTSVAAWINTECMALTTDSLDQFGICMNILNPYLCTSQGQDDRTDLITSVNLSLLALNVTHAQLPEQISSCAGPIQTDNNLTQSNVTYTGEPSNMTDNINVTYTVDACNTTDMSNVTYTDDVGNMTDKFNVTYIDANNMTDSISPCNMSLLLNTTNMTNTTSRSSSSSSDVSIGMLTRDLFRSYFSPINVSVIDEHYNALIGSLLLANINQLDAQQTAMILAAIKTKTGDLSRTDPVSISRDQTDELHIAVVTSLLSSHLPMGGNTSSINPDLVMSYISFINDLVRSNCMADVSQDLYDLCFNVLFPLSSCSGDRQGHDQIESDVRRALMLMNVNSDLKSLHCPDELTSHAFISSPISIWITTFIVAALTVLL